MDARSWGRRGFEQYGRDAATRLIPGRTVKSQKEGLGKVREIKLLKFNSPRLRHVSGGYMYSRET